MDASINSYFDNDTNDVESNKKATIARLEEVELQHLRDLEQKRHQIQVTLITNKIAQRNFN